MRSICCFLLAASLAIFAPGQTPPAAHPATHANVALDLLAGYAGEWNARIDHLDTPFGKAAHEEFRLANTCLRAGLYLACHQAINGDPKILLVFTCPQDADSCVSYPIPPDGSPVTPSKVVVSGNRAEFPWQTSDAGKTTRFRVVNIFTGADRIEFRQEYSLDGANWLPMATGIETRIQSAANQAPHA
jgi:hypothetical protein